MLPYPDRKAETSCPSCGYAGRSILEHYGTRWVDAEPTCGFKEHVGSWLAAQTETINIDPVHAHIEERRQMRSLQNFLAMVAR
jgi:hypothetical protein